MHKPWENLQSGNVGEHLPMLTQQTYGPKTALTRSGERCRVRRAKAGQWLWVEEEV